MPRLAQGNQSVFRTASIRDVEKIREVAGTFFDDNSCGFNSLEERIKAKTIFLLKEKKNILGCGIVEPSVYGSGCVLIGMFTNRVHRKKGVAKTIILHLKEWAYHHKMKPVAGCWYYNTLSRKSLESAGMITASIGYVAILKGKEKLLPRTGNAPGELVTD